MLRFRNGLLQTTFVADPGGTPAPAGAGASGAPASGSAQAQTPQSGAGASGAQAWTFPTEKPFAEYLPERVRADPSFRDIKSFEGLADSFVHAQKMIGADKASILQIPKADDEKAWGTFYDKSGRPEKVEGYKVPKRADGKDYDAAGLAFQKQILPALHEAGLSQRQIDKLVPKWNEIMDGTAKSQTDADIADKAKAADSLKAEWGNAYDDKLKLAQAAINHYTGELKITDQVLAELDASKLGNSPGLAKLLAHLGAQLKEDGLVGKEGAGFGAMLSPAEAMQQINAMNADDASKKALLDPRHPQHKEVMERRAKLFEQAYPQPAAGAA